MNNLLSEKRLLNNFSEVWQVLSPVSNKWITLKNQSDDFNECNNKRILAEMKLKEALNKVSRRNMQIKNFVDDVMVYILNNAYDNIFARDTLDDMDSKALHRIQKLLGKRK